MNATKPSKLSAQRAILRYIEAQEARENACATSYREHFGKSSLRKVAKANKAVLDAYNALRRVIGGRPVDYCPLLDLPLRP